MREKIIQAAYQLAQEGGWTNVSIRNICKKLEFTQPIVYRHFKNKEEILWELNLLGHRLMAQKVAPVIDLRLSFKAQMLAMAAAHFDFALEQPELYHILYASPNPHRDDAHKVPQQEAALLIEFVAKKIRDLKPELDSEVAYELLGGAMALIEGYCLQTINHNLPMSNADAKARMLRNLERFINGAVGENI